MRNLVFTGAVASLFVFAFAADRSHGQDLRKQFGTESDAAAQALAEGIRMMDAKRAALAVGHFEKAIQEDAELQLAFYWLSLAQHDIGQIDEAIATIERQMVVAEQTSVNQVTIDACINAGLICAKLKDEDKAGQWFTRAVTYDPEDKHKLHWKAYRNMAIGQHLRGKNLAAMLCALSGYQADPRRVDLGMITDFLKRAERDEVAQILNFGQKPPVVSKRELTAKVSAGKALPSISNSNLQMLSDLSTRFVVAIPRNDSHYYLIDSEAANEMKEITAPGPLTAGCLIENRLFLAAKGVGLAEVELETGKLLREWKIDGDPYFIAVLPKKRVAFFPSRQLLNTLDLDTGKIDVSDYFADAVAADPLQQYCYCFKRSEDQVEVGHVIINGRPVMLQRVTGNNIQTSLMKFAIVDRRPVLAELRMNAASNGYQLHVSPDGDWVGIAGGGGWRPINDGGAGSGYGVAMFASADFSHIQGFYHSDSYPQSCAVNPVTGQVAALRSGDSKVYNLAKEGEPATITGQFKRSAVWSRYGRFLYATTVDNGVVAFENDVTDAEITIAQKRWNARMAPDAAKAPAKTSSIRSKPIALAEYRSFAIKNDREATVEAISSAIKTGRTSNAVEWLKFEPYQADPSLMATFDEYVNKTDRENAGVRVYQLKKLRNMHPQHPGIDFLLGMAYLVTEQFEPAEEALISAVRLDQGQTNLSTEALRGLAELARTSDRPQAAAYCFAHLLRLDRRSERANEAARFFEEAKVSDVAAELLAGRNASITVSLGLPKLKRARGEKRLTAEEVFASAVQSVVLVHHGERFGSGFCIGEGGLILTNAHVVTDGSQVEVTPFKVENERPTRLKTLKATVLFRSPSEDMAILRVANSPESLVPLSLEERAPQTGNKVFAIGQPGLGKEVLEQTITEGIISSATRVIGIKNLIQHTAAVNPGNSGGPLLNEHGHVVGLITAKAELDSVGFAIPVARQQLFFESLR